MLLAASFCQPAATMSTYKFTICTTKAFGSTPDQQNLQPHPGYVWLKSRYSEAIPWCKVGLLKR